MTGRVLVVQGDALRLPLPDESVDLIVTSPPFYQLRQYDTSCRICEDVIASGGDPRTAFDPGWDDHVARFHHGVGLEATPQDYLDALLEATREMVRVLKPTGSLFVELGDKYSAATGAGPNAARGGRNVGRSPNPASIGIPEKSLMGLPWRYANACVDTASPYYRARFYEQLAGDLMDGEVTHDRARQLAAEFEVSPKSKGLGLILRAPIVWHHVNGLPESVRDRVRMDHSTVFHLVKSPRYYAAIDTLRTLWTGRRDSAPRSNGATTAGFGPGAWQPELATGSSGWPGAPSAPTGLPTSCSWDRSRQACSLTTCAATACASDPNTSNPSPCVRTCSEVRRWQQPTPPRPTAATGTPTTRPIPTGHPTAAACAGCACEPRTSAATGEPATLGSIPGSVWSIASDPLRLPAWLGVDHYAAFPPELPRRLILGWSPPGVCVECGQGRRPVVDKGKLNTARPQARRAQQLADEAGLTEAHLAALVSLGTNDVGRAAATQTGAGRNTDEVKRLADEAKAVLGGYTREFLLARPSTILGWACSCTPFTDHPGTGEPSGPDKRYGDYLPGHGYPRTDGNSTILSARPKVGPWREYHLDGWQAPPTRPSVILDPFSGVGTTCLVARALGRIGIGVDLSHSYSRAARWRVFESGEWQQVIERTTGRKARPLPKHDPAQGRLL